MEAEEEEGEEGEEEKRRECSRSAGRTSRVGTDSGRGVVTDETGMI
jgi:hypothetical protein